jgi:hypothetical protein
LYSNTIPVPPPNPASAGIRFSGCSIAYDTFTAPSGQVRGTVSTNYNVDFYLLSQDQYSAWSSTNIVLCSGPSSYLVAEKDISVEVPYNLNVNLPTSGQYYIVFFNQSQSLTPNVVVNIMSVGTAETYTMTSDSVYIQTNLITESVSGSSSRQQLPTNSPLLGIVAIIIVVALGAIAIRRHGKTETRSVLKTPKPEIVASDVMFCRECGAKIPRDSKFCKECGVKTEA